MAGYSGRDKSLMDALGLAYNQNGTGALYWSGFGDAEISAVVAQLIRGARASGRSAYYIPSNGFDDLLLRVALHSLGPNEAEEARKVLQLQEQQTTALRGDFHLPDLPACGIIKSNAFPLTSPGEIYEFALKKWPAENAWDYFRKCTDGKALVAAPFRGKGYAFGTIDEIRSAFASSAVEKIERVPINDEDLRHDDGVMSSLIRRALVRAFAQRAGMVHDDSAVLWKRDARQRRKEQGTDFLVHDAVVVYLRRFSGKSHVVLKPTVKIVSPEGENVPNEVERNLKNAILGWQHNAEFNQAVEGWRTIFLTHERYEFPADSGSGFKFQIQRTPVLAKLTNKDKGKQIEIPARYKDKITQVAVELPEPKLIFSNREGTGQVTDEHPVRGILRNRPFDYPLTSRQLASTVQLGVVCPKSESKRLSNYLNELHSSINPGKFEVDYLSPFPGFQSAFGISLQVPQPGDNLWIDCPAIDPSLNQEKGALELSRNITNCLVTLKASASPSVTVVFIPTRWGNWRGFETESERFNLHNFVKAFCVPQGISTQFLEENTLEDSLQCRIRWWLSLALYVKSMRTPWVLDSLDSGSAFVGLGMSLDRKAHKGSQVILGCSHIYNSQGQGLQFRLSKIENPIIRRRNAFMSFDDARLVGETIRQLFWEAQFRLPRRVVIHKLTPFMEEEKHGLQTGLTGVKEARST